MHSESILWCCRRRGKCRGVISRCVLRSISSGGYVDGYVQDVQELISSLGVRVSEHEDTERSNSAPMVANVPDLAVCASGHKSGRYALMIAMLEEYNNAQASSDRRHLSPCFHCWGVIACFTFI